MMASKVGSVVVAPGRAFSTRRVCSLSCGLGLGGTETLPSSLPGVGLAEVEPSVTTSAARYDQIEGIGVASVVMPELKFVDVERHVGFRYLVIGADDPALNQRPEAFDALSVNCADNVLVVRVPDDFVRILAGEAFVANPFVRNQQAHLGGNNLTHKAFEGRRVIALDHASDHVAVALDPADDWRLTGTQTAAPRPATVADMPVLGLAADIGFIDLDRAEQLAFGAVLHCDTNAMAHVPSGFVRAGAKHPVDLMRAHALFRVVHEERDLEPLAQGILGVLEDRPGDDGEPIAVLVATLANPMKWLSLGLPDFHVAATRAVDAIGPTTLSDERFAFVFGLEPSKEFVEFHESEYRRSANWCQVPDNRPTKVQNRRYLSTRERSLGDRFRCRKRTLVAAARSLPVLPQKRHSSSVINIF